MTHEFGRGASERLVYPFLVKAVPRGQRPPQVTACLVTIAGQAAIDSYRFNLGRGSTPADVMAALDMTVRSVEAQAGVALEVTATERDLFGLPLLTVGLITPPPSPPPRCG